MRSRSVMFALVLPPLIGVWGSCAAGTRHSPPIADISQEWAGYWNAKNLKSILTLYAPEPVFLPTVGHGWVGRASIARNFAGLLKTYDPHIELTSTRSEASGNLAYDTGTYDETVAPAKGGKAIHASGHYLFVFKRSRGAWKILEQTWTEFEPVKL